MVVVVHGVVSGGFASSSLFFVESLEGGLRVSLCATANHGTLNASLWRRAVRNVRRHRRVLPRRYRYLREPRSRSHSCSQSVIRKCGITDQTLTFLCNCAECTLETVPSSNACDFNVFMQLGVNENVNAPTVPSLAEKPVS